MANWFTKPATTAVADTKKVAGSADPPKEQPQEALPEVAPDTLRENRVVSGELMLAEEPDTENSKSIALLAQAHRAIAEAKSLDEIKGIRDKAEAARKYAQAAGLGLEIQNYAAEVKLRAERRAGALLAKLKLHGGDRREETAPERITLEDIGVSKDQSSRWQLTAAVPEKAFERYVEETRSEHGEVTTAGLLRIAREFQSKQKPAKPETEPEESASDCHLVTTVTELVATGSKFACLYIDAAWPDDITNSETGVNGLSCFTAALKQLPISELMEAHAHVHMWATDKSYMAVIDVMKAWGFEFKGALVCLNPEHRVGQYWAEAHEYLMLGVHGDLPLMERNLNSWMRAYREPDGSAPNRIRKIVERVSPGPYLELFGRKPITGWTVHSELIEIMNKVATAEEGDDAEATSS